MEAAVEAFAVARADKAAGAATSLLDVANRHLRLLVRAVSSKRAHNAALALDEDEAHAGPQLQLGEAHGDCGGGADAHEAGGDARRGRRSRRTCR